MGVSRVQCAGADGYSDCDAYFLWHDFFISHLSSTCCFGATRGLDCSFDTGSRFLDLSIPWFGLGEEV